jgi:very-short-patch-repair endonuclease/predicted GIY-YIG superfamily endonuclease
MLTPLDKTLRNRLERTIKDAREIAEGAARAALEQLGVGEAGPFAHLSEQDRELRRKLRVHGRQLGDSFNGGKIQTMDRLIEEVAYEHWHRMLFARFLAENNLLMYHDLSACDAQAGPDDPVAVTLEECEDLAADLSAQAGEGAANGWELAARFAARMLPQIFRLDLPAPRPKPGEYCVYVHQCSEGSFYIGQTDNFQRRLNEHLKGQVSWTAPRLPIKPSHWEVFQTREEAVKREQDLKTGFGRTWLKREYSKGRLAATARQAGSPVFQLTLPPEHQQKLERLVADLELSVFTASDSLGWVYQFWQAKKKDEVNAAERKIGARELPAVTQLFTEPYMVSFLLDNSLGAWWAARRLTEADLQNASSEEELREKAAIPGVPLDYLRFVRRPSPPGRGAGGEGKKKPIPDDILKNARELRKNQTDAEQLLWGLLRDRRFAGKKFRRQHPVDRYILDFYCHELKLAVELDGGQHNEEVAQHYDKERTRLLNEHGIQVIRFWNNEVLRQTDSVLEALWNALTPTPLPEGEGLWTPAAGTFDNWPEQLADLKTLDPCCGSGHFLVAAFLMLVPMRMERDGLSAREAVDAVLRENIHGLELDQRCVELAAFALALTAWKYPDLPSPSGRGAGSEGEAKPIGYRVLPELHVACSGLSVSVAKEEWKQLGLGKQNLAIALDWMHDTFKDAPLLGSLLNPAKTDAAKLVQWDELSSALEQALKQEQADEQQEVAVVAQGLAKAATLLAGRYQWVITNVPYLARGKQNERLRDFCEKHYAAAKNDLATVFLDRCLELASPPSPFGRGTGGEGILGGTVSVVLPQNWLFLTSYKKFREKLLKNDTWHLIARLGPGAFETISGEVVKAILISLSRGNSIKESGGLPACGAQAGLFGDVIDGNLIRGVDVSEPRTASEKAAQLLTGEIKSVEQAKQLENPDARVALEEEADLPLLQENAEGLVGLQTGDDPRYVTIFWEFSKLDNSIWEYLQNTPNSLDSEFGGMINLVRWEKGHGTLLNTPASRPTQGLKAVGKLGIAIHRMRVLFPYHFAKERLHQNVAVLIPHNPTHLPAIWCFCSSPDYNEAVRRIDQKLNVTNATLVKVPFDLDHWTTVAEEKYPNGLPKPYTNDPTQWIFHGHPCGSVIWDKEKKWTAHGPLRTDNSVLHVAVARLLGYRWPAELDLSACGNAQAGTSMELADEQREWVKRCEALASYADDDGIVCIPPVRGEASASDRLLNLLAAAYSPSPQPLSHGERGSSILPSPSGRGAGGEGWSNDTLAALLKSVDHAGKTLETWLREKFFTQHCKLFQHRPFIWHIWDGLRDGFAALVNYHQLDAKLLETLIYTYLGDWISRQKQDIASGVDGAQERLAAAEALKKKLELILEGEAPYDIFVRWKPQDMQPIGWDPDLGDGVRLNIRPFLSVPDVGKKGAGVLRDKPNINWNKDRGKDVESAPWYHAFDGDRINDHHLTLAEKRAAREAAE